MEILPLFFSHGKEVGKTIIILNPKLCQNQHNHPNIMLLQLFCHVFPSGFWAFLYVYILTLTTCISIAEIIMPPLGNSEGCLASFVITCTHTQLVPWFNIHWQMQSAAHTNDVWNSCDGNHFIYWVTIDRRLSLPCSTLLRRKINSLYEKYYISKESVFI